MEAPGGTGRRGVPRHSDVTRDRLRRLNLVMLLPPLAAAGALCVALDAETWWQAAVLGAGVAAALVAFERWTAGRLRQVALPCLAVTGAVWAFGVVADCGTAFYGLTIVGSHVVSQLPRRRGAAAFGLLAYVIAVGLARLLVTTDVLAGELALFVLIPAGVTGVLTGLMFPNQRFYGLVAELEASRDREAELAVARERVRFAGDLHDIQGHTLHVVKLKVALARKLVHSDPARVEQELREIHALVGDTITQTKELAHAQRRLNLSAELENAKNLFEAAGIRVHVDRGPETDARRSELLGQVLRETTTNILRHAQAASVRISLSATGITIVNDGAREGPLPELRGLSALRRRVAEDGGELAVEQRNGWFLTAAGFPHPHPDAAWTATRAATRATTRAATQETAPTAAPTVAPTADAPRKEGR
ncbi:sensor histidine kinase [Streptomyces apricus]|uniref:Sensor histidine kinase n=1 Tax=Streptomyces apricus TaxID=1828112 RepID=A0A5B0BP58_9ACTN|nr:histidine kinase [Streptomyces apricus]KAA0942789.1 sensor histidine kinase [Streptomyces apricus]